MKRSMVLWMCVLGGLLITMPSYAKNYKKAKRPVAAQEQTSIPLNFFIEGQEITVLGQTLKCADIEEQAGALPTQKCVNEQMTLFVQSGIYQDAINEEVRSVTAAKINAQDGEVLVSGSIECFQRPEFIYYQKYRVKQDDGEHAGQLCEAIGKTFADRDGVVVLKRYYDAEEDGEDPLSVMTHFDLDSFSADSHVTRLCEVVASEHGNLYLKPIE